MKSPIVLLTSLLHDVQRLEPDVKGTDRDLDTIRARFEYEGLGFVTKAFSALSDAVDEGVTKGRFCCPRNFLKVPRGSIPRLFSGMISEVFEMKTGLLKEKPNVGVLKCLREVLRLFRKLTVSDHQEEILDDKARREFRECDKSIEGVSFPSREAYLLSRVSNFCLNKLEGECYDYQGYKHGPGAVYERLAPNQKWEHVLQHIPRLVEECQNTSPFGTFHFNRCEEEIERHSRSLEESSRFGDVYRSPRPYDQEPRLEQFPLQGLAERGGGRWFFNQLLSSSERGGDSLKLGHQTIHDRLPRGRRCRLLTVPKNTGARRTITSEPCLLQFQQQALNKILRSSIRKCPILGQSLDLSDQSHNQRLALEGSLTGKWATIDLSSASDLLSLKLVQLVFGRHPAFLQDMVDCRSTEVEDKKDVYLLQKFAGMGNALTFPVQSVVFAIIAIAAIWDKGQPFSRKTFRELAGTPAGWKGNPIQSIASLVRVYGDDIIVPTEYACQVMGWLQSFGLRVNLRKSFTEGNFRESCGVDAFKGYDVTPLYLKDLPDQGSPGPSAIAGLVAASNHAWMRGLYKFSATLAGYVEGVLRKKLPLVPAKSSALGWHSRIDACNPTKWDPVLQQLVFKAPVLQPLYKEDVIDGNAALLKFYLTPRGNDSEDLASVGRGDKHLSRSQRRFSSRIVMRWMPATAG